MELRCGCWAGKQRPSQVCHVQAGVLQKGGRDSSSEQVHIGSREHPSIPQAWTCLWRLNALLVSLYHCLLLCTDFVVAQADKESAYNAGDPDLVRIGKIPWR